MRKIKACTIVIICFIVGLSTVLTSCSPTPKKPFITENAQISEQLETVVGGNAYMPVQRSWQDWEERAAGDGSDKTVVVLRVKKVSSESYYWNTGKDGKGGLTDTTVFIQSVLYGELTNFPTLREGMNFHITEYYTVDKDGNTVTPQYTVREKKSSGTNKLEFLLNHDERTNPIMKNDGEYIVCIWNGWKLSGYNPYTLECKLPDGKVSVVPEEYYVNSYLCSEVFEFGEAAYQRSSAIVSEYTARGESREANSYNLYHAMVKEAYELFRIQK